MATKTKIAAKSKSKSKTTAAQRKAAAKIKRDRAIAGGVCAGFMAAGAALGAIFG